LLAGTTPDLTTYDRAGRTITIAPNNQLDSLRRGVAMAERAGFEDIRVEDISWRIAPSVLYVPLVTAGFLWNEIVGKRSRLTRQRWENALAPLLGLAVGAARAAFGYYLISARKRSA
jgi:hypothetical protein